MANVSIKGVDRLTQRFNKIANLELKEAVQKATQLVHGQAKALAPADTGQLRGSIHMQVKDTGKEIQGCVYTNTEYAAYVEFGTGVTLFIPFFSNWRECFHAVVFTKFIFT